jgi:hypothetical protein
MRQLLLLLPVLLAFASLPGCEAARFELSGRLLAPQSELSDPRKFFASARVTLNGGQYTSFVTEDGRFSFEDLAASSYSLEVYSLTHIFDSLRFDVQGVKNVKVYRASILASMAVAVPYSPVDGLELAPQAPIAYFEEKQGFSVLDLLKNPMVLMMGLPLVLMLLMPKMTAGMSKEELESVQQNSILNQNSNAAQQMPDLSSMLAGYTSGGGSASKKGKVKAK